MKSIVRVSICMMIAIVMVGCNNLDDTGNVSEPEQGVEGQVEINPLDDIFNDPSDEELLLEKMGEIKPRRKDVYEKQIDEWRVKKYEDTEFSLIAAPFSGTYDYFFYNNSTEELTFFDINSETAPYIEKGNFANGAGGSISVFSRDIDIENSYISGDDKNELHMVKSGYNFWVPSNFPSYLLYNITNDWFTVRPVSLNSDSSILQDNTILQIGGSSLHTTIISASSSGEKKLVFKFGTVLDNANNDDIMPTIFYQYNEKTKTSKFIFIRSGFESSKEIVKSINKIEGLSDASVIPYDISALDDSIIEHINLRDYKKESLHGYYYNPSTREYDDTVDCVEITYVSSDDINIVGNVVKEIDELDMSPSYIMVIESNAL